MKKPVQFAYRPDIDGLRAIAVLSVVIFHINKHLIPGGFAGVDIFFVISGFLISLHILKDIEREKFSLLEFYRRRIKRLALPLLLVVALAMLAGYFLMLPADFMHAADSGIYALASLANIYFWLFQDTGYFAADSSMLPLLHLWSLGVEEQFYIFWPLLLMFVYRRARSKAFFIFSTLGALASFAFGEFWFTHDASFVYYMLPARAGELLAGALVALAVLRGVENRLPKFLTAPMAVAGVLLLAASFVFLNEGQVFPGMRAILPTLGAALLILAGHCGKNPVSSLLKFEPLVWIGLISYSAYLWHWPILALLRYEHIAITLLSGSMVLVAVIWLAFLSYMLVEIPAREWDAIPSRIFLFQYVLPACLIALLLFAGKQHLAAQLKAQAQVLEQTIAQPTFKLENASRVVAADVSASGVPQVPPAPAVIATKPVEVIQPMFEIDTSLHDKPRPAFEYKYSCMWEHVTAEALKDPVCISGAESAQPPRVILWGDSNAGHYVGALATIARTAGFNFRSIAPYSCPPVFNDPAAYVIAKRLPECRNQVAPVREVIHNTADVVILAGQWTTYAGQSGQFFDDLFATIKALTADGKFVLIMGKIPTISSFDINCKEKAQQSGMAMECGTKEALTSEVINANAKLKDFADHTPNVSYFDVTPYLCKNGVCSAYDAADNPLYYDTGHLSVAASWKIGDSIVRQEGVPKAFVAVTNWLNKTAKK